MKIMNFLPALLVLIFCSGLMSCDNLYFSSFDDSKLNAKTTIKNFEHLKEPIVIALPVHDTLSLFGNEDLATKQQRLGDIIAVIDTETDSVFDWIYYPGDHGWSNWRLVQLSHNPVCYAMSAGGTNEVAVLRPNSESLSVTKAGVSYLSRSKDTEGNYLHIYNYGAGDNISFYLFDVLTNTGTEAFSIQTDGIGYIDRFPSNSEGFYFVSKDYHEDRFTLRKYDYNKKDLSELNHFEMNTVEDGDETAQYDNYNANYVDENYIYITRRAFANYYHKCKIYVADKNTGVIKKTITVPTVKDEFLYDVFKINGDLYAVSVTSGTTNISLYKINLEKEEAESLGIILNFNLSENIYIRGTKIFFMRSRNTSDITFTWYDVSTKQTGEITRVRVEDFL